MYDDFYNIGLSYFDEQIEEFKDGLRKTVKEEFLKKMERLEKENQELQEVKKNWQKIKNELEQEKQNYKFKENELKQKLAHMKINELLETAKWADRVYYIDTVHGHLPPCGKCDNRRIHFKSPSGKDLTEECPICGKSYIKYIVKEVPSFELHFKTDSHIICKGYFVKYHEYGDSTTYTCQNVYDGSVKDFNIHNYNHYHTVFTSKELAQQICDKINKENNVPDNLEN